NHEIGLPSLIRTLHGYPATEAVRSPLSEKTLSLKNWENSKEPLWFSSLSKFHRKWTPPNIGRSESWRASSAPGVHHHAGSAWRRRCCGSAARTDESTDGRVGAGS
ncbi:unnamed protein product, partial [Musa acuminata subsp. burmannicoides]